MLCGWALVFLAVLACASGAPISRNRGKQIYLNASSINNPATRPDLALHSAGPAVIRAQILLDRAHYSVGQIDGSMGQNMAHAVAGFRSQHGLPPGSAVDRAVWDALNRDDTPVLVSYTITAADVKGPFMEVPSDMMEQAKLDHLGYASPLDELGERFHAAPGLLRRLNPKSDFMHPDERITVPNVMSELTGHAAKVVVSKSKNTVTVLDDQGKVIAQYPCTSGSEHDPLPIGEWKILGVARNPKFNYNPELFWDAKPEDAKATIAPGPRNPVGVVWIDLSKEHYGIHGTPNPAEIGHSQSHGCIRLTNWDASQLADLVKPGTPASLVE